MWALCVYGVQVHNDLEGTVWANRTVHSVTAPLEAAGYACYWLGAGNMLADLSGCSLPLYDTTRLGWSNVGCVLRSDAWFPVVDSFSIGGLCAFKTLPSRGPLPIIGQLALAAEGAGAAGEPRRGRRGQAPLQPM